MGNDTLFLLFTRAPQEAAIKTRLWKCCSEERRRQLLYAFVLDTLETLSTAAGCLDADVWLCPASPWNLVNQENREPAFPLPDWLPSTAIQQQIEGDLGARQANMFQRAAAAGYQKVLILGSDSPSLPAKYLIKAVERLETANLVLGPAEDGGYYLLGLRQTNLVQSVDSNGKKPVEFEGEKLSLFSGIPWSTNQVFTQVVKRAHLLGLTMRFLPEHYDVDECSDLQRLALELASHPELAPRTALQLQPISFPSPQKVTLSPVKHC